MSQTLGPQAVSTPANRDVDAIVTQIWSEALGIDSIGPEDNFFELGGTSLMAVQVLADLQAELGVSLSPRSLFDAQTIRELAAIIPRKRPSAGAGLLLARLRSNWTIHYVSSVWVEEP